MRQESFGTVHSDRFLLKSAAYSIKKLGFSQCSTLDAQMEIAGMITQNDSTNQQKHFSMGLYTIHYGKRTNHYGAVTPQCATDGKVCFAVLLNKDGKPQAFDLPSGCRGCGLGCGNDMYTSCTCSKSCVYYYVLLPFITGINHFFYRALSSLALW